MQFHRLGTTVRMAMSGAIVMLALAMSMASMATAREAGSVYQLLVDGLACPFCAYGVEKQLSKIDGVEKIDTDISAGTVTITMAIGAELHEPVAREAVEAAAFTLRGFKHVQTTGQRRSKE